MGNVCGFAADGKLVKIGDMVDHLTKGFKGGVIVGMGEEYKGEPAVIVDYPGKSGHLNRLSRLVTAAPPKPKLEDFGYVKGQEVWQKKYAIKLTITDDKIGEYKNEPCCYTNAGRPTRFSQIEPYTGQDQPEEEETISFGELAEALGVGYGDIVPDILQDAFEVKGRMVAVTIAQVPIELN